MTAAHAINICLKEVALLAEVYLALVTTVATKDKAIMAELAQLKGLVLSIDGVQPEKGNETLYLIREIQTGLVDCSVSFGTN